MPADLNATPTSTAPTEGASTVAIIVALVAASGIIGTGVVAIGKATDPCVLVQAPVQGGDKLVHAVVCGTDPRPAGAVVVRAAGLRELGGGVGVLATPGASGLEVQAASAGRVVGAIGVGFRCGPDPDHEGKLNAACNTECAACRDDSPAGLRQREHLGKLRISYDCASWLAAGGACVKGVP